MAGVFAVAEKAVGGKGGKLVAMKLDYIYECGVFSLICLPSTGLTAAKKIENETGAGVVPLRLFCSHLLFLLHIIFFFF